MSSVIISGDVSGTVTLQAPSAAGSTVINLPSTSMNMGNGGSNVSTNTAFGTSALAANTSGATNTAVGNVALQANTTGSGNGALGYFSLYSNTTGASNTALGYASLANNTTASNNTAVGYQAGYSSATSDNITAVGYQAAYANTAADNTAVGVKAMLTNTTGTLNVATGGSALRLNTTGSSNTAMGVSALFSNTTASNNTAVGYQAGYSNTTGTYNVFLGQGAGYSNAVSGTAANTFVGQSAGYYATSGTFNSFFGNGSGGQVTTGSKNTIIGGYNGNQGGLDIRTASNYIVLSDGDGNPRCYWDNNGTMTTAGGVNAIPSTTTFPALFHGQNAGGDFYAGIDNSTGGVFGNGNYVRNIYSSGSYRIYVTASSAGVYLAPAGTSWTSASDERFKTNLAPIENGLDKVSTLRSVTGRFITDEEGTSRSFLIAQDVLAVFPEAVDATDPDKLGVQYSDTIPLLVAAIKELNAKVDAQAAEIAALKGQA